MGRLLLPSGPGPQVRVRTARYIPTYYYTSTQKTALHWTQSVLPVTRFRFLDRSLH
jgi:hypothetical protein